MSGVKTVSSSVLGISVTPSMQPWCLGDLLQRLKQAANSRDRIDDLCLRQAKSQGRNRITVYPEDVPVVSDASSVA